MLPFIVISFMKSSFLPQKYLNISIYYCDLTCTWFNLHIYNICNMHFYYVSWTMHYNYYLWSWKYYHLPNKGEMVYWINSNIVSLYMGNQRMFSSLNVFCYTAWLSYKYVSSYWSHTETLKKYSKYEKIIWLKNFIFQAKLHKNQSWITPVWCYLHC